MQRLYRLCLARMKATLGPEHACRWLAEVTKHSVAELQELQTQYEQLQAMFKPPR